jgi:VWFA-related protein
MKRCGPFVAGAALLLGTLGAVAWAAQQGPIVVPGQQPPSAPAPRQQPIPETQQPLKVQVEMVHMYATVRGKRGALIPNLAANNFQVFEDGQQQKIAYFQHQTDLPLTLALLIDTSGSQQYILGDEQHEAKEFLRENLAPKDLALVMSFDTDVNLLADLTSTASILDRAIDSAKINAPNPPSIIAQGPFPSSNKPIGTDFYDAVYLASRDKLSEQAGRKAIIALTDAQDYGSQETMDDAIEAAQRANAVINIILTVDRGMYGFGEYRGASVAERMAEETGGSVIRVSGEKDLQKAFAMLSEELRSQYVIGYYPTNAARDGSFRKIKIKTTPENYHVLTRDGYYAPSE